VQDIESLVIAALRQAFATILLSLLALVCAGMASLLAVSRKQAWIPGHLLLLDMLVGGTCAALVCLPWLEPWKVQTPTRSRQLGCVHCQAQTAFADTVSDIWSP
jgi:hypothetical protein